MIDIKLEGVDELNRVLKQLPEKVGQRVVKFALKKAAGPIAQAAAAYASRHRLTGALIEAIEYKALRDRKGWPYAVRLGVANRPTFARKTSLGTLQTREGGEGQVASLQAEAKAGQLYRVNPVHYAHLLEKGHGGPHPAGAKPFMRPAFDALGGQAVQTIMNELWKATKRAAKRAGLAVEG